MANRFENLLKALTDAHTIPAHPHAVLRDAPPVGFLPDPHLGWMVIGLIHYSTRQRWARHTLRSRLRRQCQWIDAGADPESRPAAPFRGIVPGLTDWRYDVAAYDDALLAHRGTNEQFLVDLLNGEDYIYFDCFLYYFRTHRDPGPAEQRLLELLPSGEAWFLFRLLKREELIDVGEDTRLFRLNQDLLSYQPRVEEFLEAWQKPECRLCLATRIGDWPAAREAAQSLGDSTIIAAMGRRADESHREWLGWLRKLVHRRDLAEDLLHGLADARAPDLPAYLDQALQQPAKLKAAIEIFQDDPAWCPRVFELLLRGPQQSETEMWNNEACAWYLARHSYRVGDIITHLRAQDPPRYTLLIHLALEHAAELLPEFLQRALRSRSPDDRLPAAAVLALVDTSWSRRLLLDVLSESTRRSRTIECRVALCQSQDPRARDGVTRWENRHPRRRTHLAERRRRPPYFGDIDHALKEEMDALSEDVYRVRHAMPQAAV